jgi:GT2 family glycosyltransferase
MADVSVVVVTLNGLPWVERCLESVVGTAREVTVVDHGSTDGTVALVAERFPAVRLIEQANLGYGAGINAGLRLAAAPWLLVLNSDAWASAAALERLVAFAEERPEAAVAGPRLLNPDGTLQRSARGFPTLWRLATEYLFLRKLAPRSRLLNAFYAGDYDHSGPREVEWLMGAVLLVRRDAADEVGLFDEEFFLFSEETDWCYRFREAGWQVWLCPDAEFTHVGGASHGGRLFHENLRGQLRFLAKHRGARTAERARWLLVWSLRLRGLFFAGGRGKMYRDAARWLAAGSVRELLDAPR